MMLKIIRAVIEYDGTDFSGLQYQPRVRTVAGELERALSSVLGHAIKITVAGRTDAGVHATGQVISFRTETNFRFDRLTIATNDLLPKDVSVRETAIVEEGFSARAWAVERAYIYAIFNRKESSALRARYAYHVWSPLDLDRMRVAARHFLGEHDFLSFCGVLPESGPTIRDIKSISADRIGDLFRLEIRGDGFLHHMVRAITGTLVECGIGKKNPDEVPAIIAACDRKAAGLTAPAHGLYFAGARYRDGFDSFAEPPIFGAHCVL